MAGIKKLTNGEITVFCEQLAYTLKAGIPLEEGLLVIGEDLKNTEGARIILELADTVGAGGTLAAALRASGRFPHYMAQMVEIGEASGRLEQVLSSLAAYYDRQEALARNIKSSVTYPLVMIVIMAAVILVIVTQVLPVFQEVFRSLGSEMSGFVQGLLQFGSAVSRYAAVIVIVTGALVVLFFLLRTSKRGRNFLASCRTRMFKKTSAALASGKFASAMALMLGSGMDVDEALSMTEDERSRRRIALMKQKMAGGMGFADAARNAGMFSGLYGKMISVGFRTGTLDSVMERIAARYEEEAARRMNAFVSALEPTLVAVLSVIVGMILLAVMLPLLGVMSAIG